jgi:hypothetical protein
MYLIHENFVWNYLIHIFPEWNFAAIGVVLHWCVLYRGREAESFRPIGEPSETEGKDTLPARGSSQAGNKEYTSTVLSKIIRK